MTQNKIDPMTALGQMLWLCSHTPNFSKFPLNELVPSFESAIRQNNFRIYRSAEGQPLGCVCWVWLKAEHEEVAVGAMMAASNGVIDVKPEWTGGDRLWFYNYIAPFGHSRVMADDLRFNVFPGVDAHAYRVDKHGTPKRFAIFRNVPRQVKAPQTPVVTAP